MVLGQRGICGFDPERLSLSLGFADVEGAIAAGGTGGRCNTRTPTHDFLILLGSAGINFLVSVS